jgi:hypothetical protein
MVDEVNPEIVAVARRFKLGIAFRLPFVPESTETPIEEIATTWSVLRAPNWAAVNDTYCEEPRALI